MLAPAPAAPSAQRRLRPLTPAPGLDPSASEPAPTGLDPFASRHRRGTATVEELVARDIEAFSARVRS